MAFPFALAATGLSLLGSKNAGNNSKDAQRAANRAQKEINQILARQAKRQFLRDFRAQQAAVVSSSVVGGVDVESSRFQAQLGSQRSQAATATRENKRSQALGLEVGRQQDRAAKYSAKAAQFGQLTNFSSQFISFGGLGGTPDLPSSNGLTDLSGRTIRTNP